MKGDFRVWDPRKVIDGTAMLQGMLAESILKSDEPLTDSLVISGWEHEHEGLERSRQSLLELYMSTASPLSSQFVEYWSFFTTILDVVERYLSEYDDVLELL
jgi:hypothetical protein